MGACLATTSIKDADRQEVKEEFANRCDQSRYEDGACYSGEIGMFSSVAQWYDKEYTSFNQAEEFMSDNHSKWDEAMAVSYLEDDQKYWVIGGWASS